MILNERNALLCGSFDPPTLGHMDLLARAARQFDRVHISVGQNPAKKPRYTMDQRMQMWGEALHDMNLDNVTLVEPRCDQSRDLYAQTVHLMENLNCGTVVRGIRNEADLICEADYKKKLEHAAHERHIGVHVEWLYGHTAGLHVSSTKVDALMRANDFDNVRPLVAGPVFQLLQRFQNR